jgi:hypothetical protein
MNTITSDLGLSGGPSKPRRSYSTYWLLHIILRLLTADDCEIVITTENMTPAVKAARDRAARLRHRAGRGSGDPDLPED